MQRQPEEAAAQNAQAGPSDATTRSNTPDTVVVSVMAGLPSFSAQELREWNLNSSECTECRTTVPHNQLFVCLKKECEYKVKQEIVHRTPTDFFNKQKVLCGRCSFRGPHEKHSNSLEPAEKLAIKFASDETGTLIQEQFEKLAFINQEEPVDYMMTSVFNTPQLPLIPVAHYMEISNTTAEWYMKKSTLEAVARKIQECRQNGHNYVKNMAKEALDVYNQLLDDVDKDVNVVKPQNEEDLREQFEEHEERMHLEMLLPNPEDSRPASVASCSKHEPSPWALPSSTSTSSQTILASQSTQSAPSTSSNVVEPAASAPSSTTSHVATNPENKAKIDDGVARMMCQALEHRFDLIRDNMKLEDALQIVSDELHNKTASEELKLSAAQMFKRVTSFVLYYPPPTPTPM